MTDLSHHADCWRNHHACAIKEVERLRDEHEAALAAAASADCPIGVKQPELCSAGTCRACLVSRVKWLTDEVTAAERRGMERAAMIGIPMPVGPYTAEFKDGFLTAIEIFAAAIRADKEGSF